MTVIFGKTIEEVQMFATFTAQLVRECVTFKIEQDGYGYRVTLTGGF